MTEDEYDDQIAPVLREIGEKVKALGGNMIARVEWENGAAGSTLARGRDTCGATQRLTEMAARCDGNLDAVLIAALREFDCSNSMFLHSFQRADVDGQIAGDQP